MSTLCPDLFHLSQICGCTRLKPRPRPPSAFNATPSVSRSLGSNLSFHAGVFPVPGFAMSWQWPAPVIDPIEAQFINPNRHQPVADNELMRQIFAKVRTLPLLLRCTSNTDIDVLTMCRFF